MPIKNVDLPAGHKYFPGLEADEFTHPLDRDALNVLRSIPVLDQVINFINKEMIERAMYLTYISQSVRVNERMMPHVYEKFLWAVKVLDLEEDLANQGKPLPELYVTQDPLFNGFTGGTDQTFIVLNSAIINWTDEKDWFYVLAHELGHIKANHVLYLTVARIVLEGLRQISIPGIDLLVIPILEWMRKAELTADRAAAMCLQEEDPCLAIHMKFAGGVTNMEHLDLEEFIRQVDLYAERDNIVDIFSKVMLSTFRSHPFPIFRAKEIREWMNGFEYERLMRKGRTQEPAGVS